MYLFKNHEDGFNQHDIQSSGGSTLSSTHRTQSLFDVLTGEEKPRSIGILLFLLMGLLHLWAVLWFLQPGAPITMAQPLMMEISLVSTQGLKPANDSPAPPKPADPVKPKQKPVNKTIKKPIKAKKPVHKQVELPKPISTAEDLLPPPSQTETVDPVSNQTNEAVAQTSTPASASGKTGSAEPYNEASFAANYGTNPKPKYPNEARSRGWQGKVLLRVSVSAEGLSEAVNIHRSSGHDVLDESAIAAVEKWQFIPAKRGNMTVACTVIVPIIFTLNH